jgi:hypothetical protein
MREPKPQRAPSDHRRAQSEQVGQPIDRHRDRVSVVEAKGADGPPTRPGPALAIRTTNRNASGSDGVRSRSIVISGVARSLSR